jgi:hypothetical protein
MSAISTKEAVAKAKSTLLDLFGDDPPKDLALEELERVELDGQRKGWAVTLGFHRVRKVTTNTPANSMLEMLGRPSTIEHRVYKTVVIDADSGEFVKMEIRQVQ